MVTQPVNTAKVYVLSASSACSVTLTHLGQSTTWQALPEGGGQTTFIVPAGAVAEISDENAFLAPIPFKIAPGAIGCSVGGTEGGNTRDLLSFNTTKSNAVLSGLSYSALCASAGREWLKHAFLNCVHGDTAYIDLSAFAPTFNESARYYTTDTPLFAGDSQTEQIRLGEGVTGLKRMILKIGSVYRAQNAASMLLCNSDVDFTIISKNQGLFSFGNVSYPTVFNKAKSLTVICTDSKANPASYYALGHFTSTSAKDTSLDERCFNFPIKFIVPSFTSGASFSITTRSNSAWVDNAHPTHLDITASMPSYVSSFSFYRSNFNSPENLVYLMDNLGTPAADSSPSLTFGIDAALVDGERVSTPPVYFDATLQAAVDRFRAKGWVDLPIPVTEEQ